MEKQIEQTITLSTKYVILDSESYGILNHRISEAMGFDIGEPTERYAPVIPMSAKVNVQFTEVSETVVETYDTIPVMPITATVQERCTELLQGYDLLESYTPNVEDVQL